MFTKNLPLYIIECMKRFVIFCLFLMAAATFFSCGNKKANQKSPKSAAADFSEEMRVPEKKWTNEDGIICIVFGYGFNKPDFYIKATEKLQSIYGLDEYGGLILPMLFPDDFKNGILGLKKSLEGKQIKGIIFLGAPEQTCEVLSKMQEEMYNGTFPFPVISLFPQDDPFGQEATCSLIIDYERSMVEDKTANEVQLDTSSIDAEQIFTSTVKYMANLEGQLIAGKDMGAELKEVAQKIVGADKTVHRYVDRGSGMQSINHYTVESK